MKATLIAAAKAAAQLIQDNIGHATSIKSKSNINDLVTEVDRACERKVIEIIKEKYPDHQIIGEEYGHQESNSEYQWIIDPIDGTVNFAHGIPLCCVSIGLAHKGRVIMGAVYNPMMNELFMAEKGQGAFLNGQQIKVSKHHDINTSVIITGIVTYVGENRKSIEVFDLLMKGGRPVRCIGSAALSLCWVACGRAEAYFEYKLNPWDVAAGKIILEEAGGYFTDFNGNEEPVLGPETLATNTLIHRDLQILIEKK